MPNLLYNSLEIIGSDEQVKEVGDYLKGQSYENGEEDYIDSNKIIERPEESGITETSVEGTVHALLFNKNHFEKNELQSRFKRFSLQEKQEGFDMALKYQSNLNKHGFKRWYYSKHAVWETKWDAYNQELKFTFILTCLTVWVPFPLGWILELSGIFPKIIFNYYYDSDFDYYKYKIQNEEVLEYSHSDGFVDLEDGTKIPTKQINSETRLKKSNSEDNASYHDLPF